MIKIFYCQYAPKKEKESKIEKLAKYNKTIFVNECYQAKNSKKMIQ